MFFSRKSRYMETVIVLLLLFCTLSTCACAKTRIAVIDFRDSSDSGAPAEAITDMMITELFRTNKYSIIERTRIDAILDEYDLIQGGVVDPSSAIQMGKVLGIQAIITGAITEYKYHTSGGVIPIPHTDFGGVAVGSHTGYVTIDTRIIDAQTGEIILVAREQGASNQTLGGVAYEGVVFGTGKSGGILAGATHKAVTKLVDQIGQCELNTSTSSPCYANYNVLQCNGSTVMIDGGSQNSSIQLGQFLVGYQEGEALKSMSGEVLDVQKNNLAILVVREIMPKYSRCEIIRGRPLQRGDKASVTECPDTVQLTSRI